MRILLVMLMMLISSPVFAQNGEVKNLTVDLAEDHVDITTGFNGAKLVLFGMRENDSEVAVVIRGPERTIITRRKENVMGAWLNGSTMRFRRVPLYYDYAASRPEAALGKPDVLKAAGIGFPALYFEPDTERESAEYIRNFQEALLRDKQSKGLYPLKAKEIVFLNDNLFRASFYLPSNVPTGSYQVMTYLLKDGQITEKRTTSLRVAQVGFGARVFEFAHMRALSYGLLCVFVAVAAGWTVNLLRPEV